MKKILSVLSFFRSFVLSNIRKYEHTKLRTYETTKSFFGHIVYFFETALKGFRVDFRKIGIALCLVVFFVASYGPVVQAADVETNKEYVDWVRCILRNKPQSPEEMTERVAEQTPMDAQDSLCLSDVSKKAPGHLGTYTANEAGWILQTTYQDIYGKPEEFVAHKIENILIEPEEENGAANLPSAESNALIEEQLDYLEENSSRAGEFNFENPPTKDSSLRFIIDYYLRNETGDITDSYVYKNNKEDEFYFLLKKKLNYSFYEKVMKFISLYTAKDLLWTANCENAQLTDRLYTILNKGIEINTGGKKCYAGAKTYPQTTDIVSINPDFTEGSAYNLSTIDAWMRDTGNYISPLGEIIKNKSEYPAEYVSYATAISNAGSRVIMDLLLDIELVLSSNLGDWEDDDGGAAGSKNFSQGYFTKRDFHTIVHENKFKNKAGIAQILARGNTIKFKDEDTETDIDQYMSLLPINVDLVGPPLPTMDCYELDNFTCKKGTDPESNKQYGPIASTKSSRTSYNVIKENLKYFEYISAHNFARTFKEDSKAIDPSYTYDEKILITNSGAYSQNAGDGYDDEEPHGSDATPIIKKKVTLQEKRPTEIGTTLALGAVPSMETEGSLNIGDYTPDKEDRCTANMNTITSCPDRKASLLWPFFVYRTPETNEYHFSFLEALNAFYGGDIKTSPEFKAVSGFKDEDGQANVFEWTQKSAVGLALSNPTGYSTKMLNVFGEFGSFEPWYNRWEYADHTLSNEELSLQELEQGSEYESPWGNQVEVPYSPISAESQKVSKAYRFATAAMQRFSSLYFGQNKGGFLEFLDGDRDILGVKTIIDTSNSIVSTIDQTFGYLTTDYISLLGTGYSSHDPTAALDFEQYKDDSWWRFGWEKVGYVAGLAQTALFCDVTSGHICTNIPLKFKKADLERMATELQAYVSKEVTSIQSIQEKLQNMTLEDTKDPEKVRLMEGEFIKTLARISNLELTITAFFSEISDVAQWVKTARATYIITQLVADIILLIVTWGGWSGVMAGKYGVTTASVVTKISKLFGRMKTLMSLAKVIINPLSLIVHLKQIRLFFRPFELAESVTLRLEKVGAKIKNYAGESSVALSGSSRLARWAPIRNSFKKYYQWQEKYLTALNNHALRGLDKIANKALSQEIRAGTLSVAEMETMALRAKRYEELLAQGIKFEDMAQSVRPLVPSGAGTFRAANNAIEAAQYSRAMKSTLSAADGATYSRVFPADVVAQAEATAAQTAASAFEAGVARIRSLPDPPANLDDLVKPTLSGAERQLLVSETRQALTKELNDFHRQLRRLPQGANTAAVEANILQASNRLKALDEISLINQGLLNMSRTKDLKGALSLARQSAATTEAALEGMVRAGTLKLPPGVSKVSQLTDVQIQELIRLHGPRSPLGNHLGNYLNEAKNILNLERALMDSYLLIRGGKALLSAGGKLKNIFRNVRTSFNAYRAVLLTKTFFDTTRLFSLFRDDNQDPCSSEFMDESVPKLDRAAPEVENDDYYAANMRKDLQEIYNDSPPEWAESISTNLSWIRDINREFIPIVFSNFILLKDFSQLISQDDKKIQGELAEWPIDKQTRLFNILKGNLMISLNNVSDRLFDFNIDGMCGNAGQNVATLTSKQIKEINLAGITYFGGGKGSANELSIKGIIQTGIRLLLLFISGLAIIAMIYSGILFTRSNGNEENVKHARLIFINAAIGLAVAFFAFLIVAIVQGILYSI